MSSHRVLQNLLLRRLLFLKSRGYGTSRIFYSKPASTAAAIEPNLSGVTGLSNKVVAQTSNPVGPGASKNSNYKNPEYFLYNRTSFFEAEIEMAKYRCPQPSNKAKS